MRDTDIDGCGVVAETGQEPINIAGDSKASITKSSRFVPREKDVQWRAGREAAGPKAGTILGHVNAVHDRETSF